MTTRRDRGAVLPLVLVMIVVAGLIVIPLMDYAITVFKANHVVSQRTSQLEAAKGGLRVALADPRNVFLECDQGGTLPETAVNEVAVTTTCAELREVGPFDALGWPVPVAASAMQLGATVPQSFSGDEMRASSPVPPYPPPGAEDWWFDADDPQHSSLPEASKIWMPHLPQFPATARAGGFAMPGAFGCTVYFPGTYANPLNLATGRHYFTSGVYYFASEVRVRGTADVVVGYGLEEFTGSDCADDIQAAANVLTDPGVFDINGGGATWVFGANGRLVVDGSGSNTPSLRFNQRYAEPDRGGRISIVSVNGATTSTYHSVDHVNRIPNSRVLRKTGEAMYEAQNIAAGTYAPSSPVASATAPLGLTDAVHDPVVAGVTVRWLRTAATTGSVGGVIVSWDASEGYDPTGRARAGGALLDGLSSTYTVTATRGSNPSPRSCAPADITYTPAATPGAPGRMSCLITGLGTASGTNNNHYTVAVTVRNELGRTGSANSATGRPSTNTAPNSDVAVPPGAPTSVAVTSGADDGAAVVSWTAPVPTAANSNRTPPIVRYEVQAYRVFLEAPATPGPSVVREETLTGYTCETFASHLFPVDLKCTISGLPDLVPGDGVTGDLGYRFGVKAYSTLPATPSSGYTHPLPSPPFTVGSLPTTFDGGGEAPLPTNAEKLAERVVEPWMPTPIIEILSGGGAGRATVAIAGYVTVPMGRIRVSNPEGDTTIKLNGGVAAGTFAVDSWMQSSPPQSVPIGFKNDIVLQRRLRVTSTAGRATSTAVVEVNEDGDGYAINSWVIQ